MEPRLAITLLAMLLSVAALAAPEPDKGKAQERTSFQSFDPWNPGIDIRTDVAMVYGIDPSLPDRLKTWADRGYIPQVMTGVSWGEYQDYLYGRFDGKNHEDAAQQRKDGSKISHGGDVYYMVPEEPFGRFLCVGVKRAIDAGAQAIYLEEPEFWAAAGWSPAFQREWKAFYGEDWQAPDSSPEARYRSGKLKYYLYKRALGQVFQFVKEYGKQIGRTVRCYVPTHSMLNYACWGIVSPESSLATLDGCDGYIAQVWTGTARTPNWYNGARKERTFETAYLEYGSMHNLARATGRRMIFLADPIEDDGNHSWTDYKTNYEQTLTASLLWPDITHFEVVPWPQRVFQRSYPTVDVTHREPGQPVVREPIPPLYASELIALFETLKHMDQKDVELHAAARGVGVLVSDSLMFHRGGPNDPSGDLSHVYGALLPLLKRGVAVEPVQLENAPLKDYLKPYKLLVLSYVGQKPLTEAPHEALAEWVKSGGVLVLLGKPDEFATMREWWNKAPNAFASPEAELLHRLGAPAASGVNAAVTKVGRGCVITSAVDPRAIADKDGNAFATYQGVLKTAFGKAGVKAEPTNALWLRRGPYVVGAVMEETESIEPLNLKGRYLDLFAGHPSVLVDPSLRPGKRFLLLDLDRAGDKPHILSSACETEAFTADSEQVSFRAIGPKDVKAYVCLRLPAEPTEVTVADKDGLAIDCIHAWSKAANMASVEFPNAPEGLTVTVRWKPREEAPVRGLAQPAAQR
ncbi:MAG TPA: hypothetical protein VGM37_12630 [Armatimonadota bacterium]|jgi:hypothetical protein